MFELQRFLVYIVLVESIVRVFLNGLRGSLFVDRGEIALQGHIQAWL